MPKQPVLYGWALDQHNRPVPIAKADRHGVYRCPLCTERMIPKKGVVNQHHFARESLSFCDECTANYIAQLIASTWLVLELGEHMVRHESVPITWNMNTKSYTADLLQDVQLLVEKRLPDSDLVTVSLQYDVEHVRCVFVLSIEKNADPEFIQTFVSNSIACIEIPPEPFRSGQMTLKRLLELAVVHGGWLLLGDINDPRSPLVTAPETIRQILYQSVMLSPYYLVGPLVRMGEFMDVLVFGDRHLWLSPEIWQAAVGGTRNRITSELSINLQEWPQPDGSTILLYYVTLRKDERAIAVRRFAPGEPVQSQLGPGYQLRRTTPQDIAHWLATR